MEKIVYTMMGVALVLMAGMLYVFIHFVSKVW